MKSRSLVIIGLSLTVIIIIVLFYKIHNDALAEMKAYPAHFSINISDNYRSLLADNDKIKVLKTTSEPDRWPVTDIKIDNKYVIEIIRLNGSFPNALDSTITVNQKDEHISYDYTYSRSLEQIPFYIRYILQGPAISNTIIANVSGDQINIQKQGDTVISCFAYLKNFSLKYGLKNPQDIHVEQENDTKKLPIEIMFRKKSDQIYLIMIMGKDESIPVYSGLYKKILR
ncbi:hypothetical protein ACFQZX_04210 [Mucilaginibacter litoreus]|uniref:Uncharacterized protein n=1 Tax=Mucilaginibacter litoreus TaxID=1048221 RepID=A0ABW3AP48_9SPHI